MFGDLFGNLEEKQAQIQEQLAAITLEAEAGSGAIKVQANGLKEILNISIDKEKLDYEDVESVEDLLVVAVNRVIELAMDKEAALSESLLNDMMPPNLGDLKNLFG